MVRVCVRKRKIRETVLKVEEAACKIRRTNVCCSVLHRCEMMGDVELMLVNITVC